jgi:signal transduction histidine kinase
MASAEKKQIPIPILCVEDDKSVRELLLSLLVLKYRDQRFFSADNGLAGLEKFKELQPAIVITDISMPELDGISMAARIKESAPETIIIALTAHSETDKLLRAIEVGINYYVLKPLDLEKLCAVLDKSINTVRKEQQLRDQFEEIHTLNDILTARTNELETMNFELETFNYTVAHDLRSPLVCISGYAQYLLEKFCGALDEQGVESLRVICSEAERMNNLIKALLNFSKYSRKSIEKQWTDFSRLAEEIACNLQLREPQRQVDMCITADVQGIADPVLAGVVLENLLGNAWKYTAHNAAARIEFGFTGKDGEPVYYVQDNGAGFDQDEAHNLFLPFRRLQDDTESDGFGIGLATVQRIIQRHGGTIWAEGKKGEGATFYFTFN